MRNFIFLIFILLIASCSSEKPADVGGQKPAETIVAGTFSIEITPINVTRASTIYLVPHGFNLPDAKIEWLVNGDAIPNSSPDQFKAAELKKRDKVQVKATIQGREILSNEIQIQNSLPVLSSVRIMPEVFKPGDRLYIEASATDPDGDDVTISYEWTKNGEPAGNSKQIEASIKRGDKIDVKITPNDGEADGHHIVLHREISNYPPAITERKKTSFDNKLYTCQINAVDPEGDSLVYSLRKAPSGMTINPVTGLIQWNVPDGFKGKAPCEVSVSDGHGGVASQNLAIDIRPE
jgi:hypothetical protein